MENKNKNVYHILQDQIDHDKDMDQINAMQKEEEALAESIDPAKLIEKQQRDESHLLQSAFAAIENEDEEEMEDLSHEVSEQMPSLEAQPEKNEEGWDGVDISSFQQVQVKEQLDPKLKADGLDKQSSTDQPSAVFIKRPWIMIEYPEPAPKQVQEPDPEQILNLQSQVSQSVDPKQEVEDNDILSNKKLSQSNVQEKPFAMRQFVNFKSFKFICDYLDRQLQSSDQPATLFKFYVELALQDGDLEFITLFFSDEFHELTQVVNQVIYLRVMQPGVFIKLSDYIMN